MLQPGQTAAREQFVVETQLLEIGKPATRVVTEIGAPAHRLGAARAAVAGDDENFRINVDVGIADLAIAQPDVDQPLEILGSDLHAFLQERSQPALRPQTPEDDSE